MKKQLKSSAILLVTAMIWGFAFVAQLVGTDELGSFSFNAIRFILGAIALVPVFLIFEKEKIEKEKLKTTFIGGTVAGVVLFIASTLQQSGIIITGSAGKAGFITGLYMVIVPIIGLIFLKRKTNVGTWLGVAFAVAGLYLLSFSNGIGSVGIGDIVLLIGAVVWAVHITVIDRFVSKTYPIRLAATQALVCGILATICMFIFEDVSLTAVLNAKYPLLYAGIMSSGIAYMLQIVGQKDAEPTLATILLSTESLFSVVGEVLFFTFIVTDRGFKSMTTGNYIGCALMFVGIILAQIDFKIILRSKK